MDPLHNSLLRKQFISQNEEEKMWTKEMFDACFEFFLERAESDPIAERFVWLLMRVGLVPMYEDICVYNRVIEVVLTQRVRFAKSGKVKRELSSLMGSREYKPEELLARIENDRASLIAIGIDEYVLDICKAVTDYTIEKLASSRNSGSDPTTGERDLTTGERDLTTGERDLTTGERDLTTGEIEGMSGLVKGFSDWSVNVSCINYTFSPRYEGMPYNALTNRDPVVKRGFYWLTGIDPYDAVIDQLSDTYAPYSGVITRYLWEAFNYNRIPVKLPKNYKKWWNKGKKLPEPYPRIDSQFDTHLEKASRSKGK